MAYKVFTNGSVLNASEINDNLMNQSVISFTNAAARTSAITSPIEGQVTWLEDQNILSIYDGSAWKTSLAPTGSILQVVTATTNTQTVTTSTAGVNTALSVNITPKSASSKILVTSFNEFLLHTNNVAVSILRLRRGATVLDAGASLYFATSTSGIQVPASLGILDSPNTTSTITYGTYLLTSNAANTATVRDRQNIIAMEVSA